MAAAGDGSDAAADLTAAAADCSLDGTADAAGKAEEGGASAALHGPKVSSSETITLAGGIQLSLACLTVSEHYAACDSSVSADFTGLRAYNGCRVLAHLLARDAEFFSRAAGGGVCELGAGLGLASLTAAIFCSPTEVLLTDGSSAAVAVAEKNVAAARAAGVLRDDAPISCRQLWWGVEPSEELLKRRDGRPFRLMLAGDCLYAAVPLDALLASVAALLAEDGIAIFCHTPRVRGGNDALVKAAADVGLSAWRLRMEDVLPAEPVRADWWALACIFLARSADVFEGAPWQDRLWQYGAGGDAVFPDSDDDDDEAGLFAMAVDDV
eukprot:PLAT8463.1.p1 GENE.PLAT8463.1~~PLAT8463.1.p1  ORF type:complete len:325 (-),score=111.07 PLAT8463.1:42-1016(-)